MTKKRLSRLLVSLSLVFSGISFIDIPFIKNTNIAYSDTIVESGKRKALIIGNKNYSYTTSLDNTHRDADAVSKKLSELNFEVTKRYDVKNKKDMKSVVQDFYNVINPNDTVFVYYSGHGVQIGDKNYLVPTDADLKIETDADDEALSVDYLIKSLKDKSNVLFVILDACRDNPLKNKSLGSKKGLQPIRSGELVGSQLVVLYATSENETASDYHPVKKNLGLFAGELIDVLGMENKTSDSIFNQLTSNLKKLSNGKQIPYKHTQLEGDFYFNQIASVSVASINNGIYFTDKYKDKPNYFPNGYTEHIFNKYLDSISLCRTFLQLKDNDLYLKKQYIYGLGGEAAENLKKIAPGDECAGNLYTDERNFVGINLLYSKNKNYVNDILKIIWEDYGFRQINYSLIYDSEYYRPSEGDLMQIRIYVHDNAVTDPNNVLKDTKVSVKLDNNKVTTIVGNTETFSSANAEVNFGDNSNYELAFAKSSDYPSYKFKDGTSLSDMGNYITYRNSKTDKKTLITTHAPLYTRNLKSDEYSISSERKSFVFYKGEQIAGFPYAYTITLDLVVKRKN